MGTSKDNSSDVSDNRVEVTLQHSQDATRVMHVMVPETATFLAVKEAMVAQTGNTDILTRVKLARKIGGAYSNYKDHRVIGEVRHIIVLGGDVIPQKSEEPEQDHEVAKPPIDESSQSIAQPSKSENREDEESPTKKMPLVKVCVRHSVRTNQEVNIMVPLSGTIRDIKECLARKLGSKIDNLRLAKKEGKNLEVMDDAQSLGSRRELFVMGLDMNEVIAEQGVMQQEPPTVDSSNDLVEVVVKNSRDGEEITVKVLASASLGQVKNAVVELLGRSDLADAGTFIEKDGDGVTSLTDAECLGDRRCLLMLGTRLVPSGRPSDADTSPTKNNSLSCLAQSADAATCLDSSADIIEVIVKHPFKERHDKVCVPSVSTIKDLRKALLQNHEPSDLSAVRFATRMGNNFKWFTDDAPLGNHREFVVTGLTLLSIPQESS